MSTVVSMFDSWDAYAKVFSLKKPTEGIDLPPRGFSLGGLFGGRHHYVTTMSVNQSLSELVLQRRVNQVRDQFSPYGNNHSGRRFLAEFKNLDFDVKILEKIENIVSMIQAQKQNAKRHHSNVDERFVISILYSVLTSDLCFPDQFTVMSALRPIMGLLNVHCNHGIIPPFATGDVNAVFEITDLKLVLDDFRPSLTGLVLKTEYPSLYPLLENFILLKDEIEKIKENLYSELEMLINRLLATDNITDLLADALVYFGKLDPFSYETLVRSPERSGDDEDFLGFSSSPMYPNADGKQTLLSKFKLDCACHNEPNDYKLRILGLVFTATFNMVAV